MRITVKVGVICAAVWIALKMALFYGGLNIPSKLPIAVLLNILGVLLSIAIGLYLQKRKDTEEGNALRDIKNGMTAGVPYTILVSVFIYFYYAKIDPEFNQKQIADAEMQILQTINSPEGLKEIQASNQKYEVMAKDEIYAEMRKGPQNIYSAKFTMTVGLLAMLLLATVNSILITIVYRKVMFRRI